MEQHTEHASGDRLRAARRRTHARRRMSLTELLGLPRPRLSPSFGFKTLYHILPKMWDEFGAPHGEWSQATSAAERIRIQSKDELDYLVWHKIMSVICFNVREMVGSEEESSAGSSSSFADRGERVLDARAHTAAPPWPHAANKMRSPSLDACNQLKASLHIPWCQRECRAHAAGKSYRFADA